MRIVVSGTHASGKSTLISDFALRHPGYTVLSDTFDVVDEAADAPDAALFASQLRIAADRLHAEAHADLIAERGPLDFLAYLLALDELGLGRVDDELFERARMLAVTALETIDLVVVLPLSAADAIHVADDEYLELREAMDAALLDLLDDPDLVAPDTAVVELTGAPDARLAALEQLTVRGA